MSDAERGLHAGVGLRRGGLDVDVHLDIAPGEVLALLGPNGAGKTTVLHALAGLLQIQEGVVRLDGQTLDDPSDGVFVAPERRPVGVVFQDYLLFPHLSVLDNVAFGLRAGGVAKAAARREAAAWVARVGLEHVGSARPTAISGGQAQRVALARALATDPRLLLLDEPLAALDATTRSATRRDLRAHLDAFGGATVLVTHDPLDALALADTVMIVEAGNVTQSGPIAEVTSRPRTTYVADLLGVNLLRGHGDDHAVRLEPPAGGTTAAPAVVAVADHVDGATFLLVRPQAVALHRAAPETSARNVWHCTVAGFDLLGEHVRVRLVGDIELVADVTPSAVRELGLVEGSRVWASVKATDITAFAV